MGHHNPLHKRQAEQHFRDALRKARREQFQAWLTGKENHLLSFEAVRAEIQTFDPSVRTLQEIPVEKIVGSVGRYDEFTSHFLPLKESLHDRWVKVEVWAMEHGWPPIHVYQVGDCYFVVDGNHRVAVARQMDYETIEAYVSVVPFTENLDLSQPPDQMLIEVGRNNFFGITQLDKAVPDHNIVFTTPARYRHCTEQIVHFRQVLNELDEEEMSLPDAALAWYEMVYSPTALLIEMSDLVDHFPGRTTADLFIWLFVNREALREKYGDYENLGDLVGMVSADFTPPTDPPSLLSRAREVLQKFRNPDDPAPLPDLSS